MKSLPRDNPISPWESQHVDYLGDPPQSPLEVYEDDTRSILSKNDSPDLGFTWSINPYRGCYHGCAYCLSEDTPILMGDGTTRLLRDVRVGDVVYGTVVDGRYRHYALTPVLASYCTVKPAYRIRLEDGTELVCSDDHRFLTLRGWKYATNVSGGQRPHLTFNDKLLGVGGFAIRRKTDIAGQALKRNARLRVMSIEPLGIELPMVDITTGTEDFIANGVVAHNCYARPTHEYLGFGAGTDFERKIVVKRRAAELLRKVLCRRSWTRESILFSGNTDCYQPLEATYRLTRACLEACADFANPAYVITKAPLIERDLDVLLRLSERADVGVTLSIPFWDAETARILEPGVATPARRFVTIERLAQAGIDVSVNVAPVIPGLTDRHIPRILEAAAAAGARSAGMTMLRLPGSVREVFESRLRAGFPLAAERVLSRTREVRGGRLNDPRFGSRMRGEGQYAEAIEHLFRTTAKRLGLSGEPKMARKKVPLDEGIPPPGAQLRLFDGE